MQSSSDTDSCNYSADSDDHVFDFLKNHENENELTPLVPKASSSSLSNKNNVTTPSSTTISTPLSPQFAPDDGNMEAQEKKIFRLMLLKYIPNLICIGMVSGLLIFYVGRFTASSIPPSSNPRSNTPSTSWNSPSSGTDPTTGTQEHKQVKEAKVARLAAATKAKAKEEEKQEERKRQEAKEAVRVATKEQEERKRVEEAKVAIEEVARKRLEAEEAARVTAKGELSSPPSSPPTSNPTTGIICVDDVFKYRGKKKYNCKWVGKGSQKKIKKQCQLHESKKSTVIISSICRATCGKVGVGPCQFIADNKRS